MLILNIQMDPGRGVIEEAEITLVTGSLKMTGRAILLPPYNSGQLGWCWGDVEMMATDLWLMATSSSYNKDKIFKLPTSWGNTLLLSGINVSNAIIRSIKTRITILCYWKTMKECFRILKYCQFCLCFCNLLSWWIRNAKVFERIKENLSVVQQTKKCLETCWGRNSTDQKTRM